MDSARIPNRALHTKPPGSRIRDKQRKMWIDVKEDLPDKEKCTSEAQNRLLDSRIYGGYPSSQIVGSFPGNDESGKEENNTYSNLLFILSVGYRLHDKMMAWKTKARSMSLRVRPKWGAPSKLGSAAL